MAGDLTPRELKLRIRDPETLAQEAFSIIHGVAALTNEAEQNGGEGLAAARDLVIRLLDSRRFLGHGESELLDALVRRLGLFPYLDPEALGVADLIALEAHRPLDMPEENLVFHQVQGFVYRRLLEGDNVILSAPMSFGKSLIIDALIASGRYKNCVIVVPTIALLDEARRRLARFRHQFKIITHASQTLADQNLIILTQERVIDLAELPPLDLFVIDEFYKLDARADPERGHLLNQAFYRLWKTGAQFYFLGPHVEAMAQQGLPQSFDYRFIKTDYNTIAFDVVRVPTASGEEEQQLVDLCFRLDEPTLIYCRSPQRTRAVARWLLDAGLDVGTTEVTPAVEWIGEQFHPDWLLPKALAKGIGLHHGRIPRSLGHYMVRAFNERAVQFLVCTSTLIEGVNTTAKNVVIFDSQVARQQLDYFTFNNILGRSGRMFKHFIGQVFLFHEPPSEELPLVDIPVLSQPDSAPDSLLVHVDPDDLSQRARERLDLLLDQNVLSVDVLRANTGTSIEDQLKLARRLIDEAERWNPLLAWDRTPDWERLVAVCELMWDHVLGQNPRRAGTFSARQLAYRISRLRRVGSVSALIKDELEGDGEQEEVDDVVETVLEFLRQWPGHSFPRGLVALDRIQKEVFGNLGLPAGDYTLYASQVENLFQPPSLTALDEFGIPLQVAQKIAPWLSPEEDLDLVLARLGAMDVGTTGLSRFEQDLVRDAQDTL